MIKRPTRRELNLQIFAVYAHCSLQATVLKLSLIIEPAPTGTLKPPDHVIKVILFDAKLLLNQKYEYALF